MFKFDGRLHYGHIYTKAHYNIIIREQISIREVQTLLLAYCVH